MEKADRRRCSRPESNERFDKREHICSGVCKESDPCSDTGSSNIPWTLECSAPETPPLLTCH